MKLVREELPASQPEGIYLVDPGTHEAKYQRDDGIGAGKLRAPQAKLMSTVIDGLLTHRLPWDLILLGVAIAVFMELLGVRSLTFAVGVYLPLAATMPVFLGGLVRRFADKAYGRTPDAEDEPQGTLYSSGLIAGASILGILAAAQTFLPGLRQAGGTVSASCIPELVARARRVVVPRSYRPRRNPLARLARLPDVPRGGTGEEQLTGRARCVIACAA